MRRNQGPPWRRKRQARPTGRYKADTRPIHYAPFQTRAILPTDSPWTTQTDRTPCGLRTYRRLLRTHHDPLRITCQRCRASASWKAAATAVLLKARPEP